MAAARERARMERLGDANLRARFGAMRSAQYPDLRIVTVVLAVFPLAQWRTAAPRLQWRDRHGIPPGS